MSKHTPGPWSFDGHGINHNGERIFKSCLDYAYNSPDRERMQADSVLVAAAPKLLDALKVAVDKASWQGISEARQAIQEAEAKQ